MTAHPGFHHPEALLQINYTVFKLKKNQRYEVSRLHTDCPSTADDLSRRGFSSTVEICEPIASRNLFEQDSLVSQIATTRFRLTTLPARHDVTDREWPWRNRRSFRTRYGSSPSAPAARTQFECRFAGTLKAGRRETRQASYASSFNAVSVLMRVAASMSLRASDSSGW
jgi:hypothetical protein